MDPRDYRQRWSVPSPATEADPALVQRLAQRLAAQIDALRDEALVGTPAPPAPALATTLLAALERNVDAWLPDRNTFFVWAEDEEVLAFKHGYDRWWLTDSGRARDDVPAPVREDDRINRATRDFWQARATAQEEEQRDPDA